LTPKEFVVTVNTVGSSDCTTPDGGDVKVDDDLIRLDSVEIPLTVTP
jgi:hypothetical protein